ncbi:MAG: FxLYD domain-containing protein [Acidobacteriota bacterium]
MKQKRIFGCCLLILAFTAPARIALAEVLVLRDGGRMETAGPWKVDGALVVFTLPSGRLSSVRLSAVDLESSHAVARQVAPPVVRRERPRRPVLVFTDDDIPRAAERTGVEAASDAQATRDPRPTAMRGLVVETWAEVERPEINGVEIVGWLKNRGSAVAEISSVRVELRDASGERLEDVYATTEAVRLEPRETTRFRAEFRGVGRDRGRPRFVIEAERGNHHGLTAARGSDAVGR